MLVPPIWTGHSDFTNLFEFATFMRMADGLDFDVMLEGKAKDISLLKLRPDLLRYAPDVAARFGIFADAAERLARERAWRRASAQKRRRTWTRGCLGPASRLNRHRSVILAA